jgi:hypothetical protein
MTDTGRSDTMQADIRDLSHPYWAMEVPSGLGLDMAILAVDRQDETKMMSNGGLGTRWVPRHLLLYSRPRLRSTLSIRLSRSFMGFE